VLGLVIEMEEFQNSLKKRPKFSDKIKESRDVLIVIMGLVTLVTLFLFGAVNEDDLQSFIKEEWASKRTSEVHEEYLVTEVIDGDTLRIIYGDEERSVRLIGIDTPETRHPTAGVECFGKEATAKLESLVDGKVVTLEFDPTQDKEDRFGRLLLYVWVDELFINRELIKQGYAYEYTYDDPYRYQQEFKRLEEKARSREVGLWGDVCN
jgi:micrococcal nuclease